jgi:hypothetical protein
MRYALALIFILAASVLASAGGNIAGKIGRGTPYGFNGGISITGGIGSGSTPPPVGCGTGVIDAGAGCPLPMLGM